MSERARLRITVEVETDWHGADSEGARFYFEDGTRCVDNYLAEALNDGDGWVATQTDIDVGYRCNCRRAEIEFLGFAARSVTP